jgi:hypothetical protein
VNEADNQKEFYFETVIVSVIAIFVLGIRQAGIALTLLDMSLPILFGVAMTVALAVFRNKQEKIKTNNVSSLLNPANVGFQVTCVAWMLILFRKARGLEEGAVEEFLLTGFVTGVTIALCFRVLLFINQKIEKS